MAPVVAILSGGLATRMRPMTERVPKALLEVAGEPFVAWQLRLLAAQGFDRVVLCVGYLGEQVEDFVGDGARFGVRAAFARDGARPLGTGGALRAALDGLGDAFIVLYGDSYLPEPMAPFWRAFETCDRPAMMSVIENADRWDLSNVELRAGEIAVYDKKYRTPAMRHIDYGMGALRADVLARFAAGSAFDLADVYRDLAARGKLAGYVATERFYEIGSPSGLAETDAYLRARAR